MVMKNIKVIAAFIAGAAIAGSVATASTNSPSVVKACADKRTNALYLSPSGTCSSARTLVELGGSEMNSKTIASLVTPSVVSISVTAPSGSGTGSGSIYKTTSAFSYIITNNHVISTAATSGTIKIELTNGEQYPATIVGRDPGYDLAVLKVQIGNLSAITVGDSSKISVGDPVLAIGSPLGLASTVTSESSLHLTARFLPATKMRSHMSMQSKQMPPLILATQEVHLSMPQGDSSELTPRLQQSHQVRQVEISDLASQFLSMKPSA